MGDRPFRRRTDLIGPQAIVNAHSMTLDGSKLVEDGGV